MVNSSPAPTQIQIQYDGHVALVQGLDIKPQFLAPFTADKADDYEKGGIPMTVDGDVVYLHTQVGGGDYLILTGHLADVMNRPFTDRPTIKRNTESVAVDPHWVMSPHLRDYQAMAVTKALKHKRCVISIPTGGGKSMVIEEICKALGHVLILVPSKLLLHQMGEQLKGYDLGLVGDGYLQLGHRITVAIPDTLYEKRDDATVRAWLYTIPAMVVDECHTFSNPTGAVVSSLMRGTQYRVGLSATPCMDNLLKGVLGALVYKVKEETLIASGHILAPTIKVVKAPHMVNAVPAYLHQWYFNTRGTFSPMLYQALYQHCILNNESRNALIANIAREYVNGDNGPLIIVVSRIEDTPEKVGKNGKVVPAKVSHASILGALLTARGLECRTLSGKTPDKVKTPIVRGLGDGSLKLVIAGASILKEGVNIIHSTGTIIAGAGRGGKEQAGLIQQVGRLLRPAEGKGKPTLYIIEDDCHTLFANQSKALIAACTATYGAGNVMDYVYGE